MKAVIKCYHCTEVKSLKCSSKVPQIVTVNRRMKLSEAPRPVHSTYMCVKLLFIHTALCNSSSKEEGKGAPATLHVHWLELRIHKVIFRGWGIDRNARLKLHSGSNSLNGFFYQVFSPPPPKNHYMYA